MDLENEKYKTRTNQLQIQVDELFAEKKILENKISILYECLSLEKVKQKISVLENKQKQLTSLEGMVNKLKIDIKPLEYLKQVLQKQFVGSSLHNDDYIVKEPKKSESSQIVTSGCSTESFDVPNDINSEKSVEILSDDEIVILDTEDFVHDDFTTVNRVKTIDEALMDASLVHSITYESPITSIGSIEPSPNVRSVSKDSITLMDSSSTSEHLLNMFDIVNEQDFQNDSECDKIYLEYDTRKIESTAPELNQLNIAKEPFGNSAIKQLEGKECDDSSSLLFNSWVHVNDHKSNTSIKNKEQECTDLLQTITVSQIDKMLQKVNTDLSDSVSSTDNTDCNNKNTNSNPVFSTINPKCELFIQSSMFNSNDFCKCNPLKVNDVVCEAPMKFPHVKNDELCNQFEPKEFCQNENLENIESYLDYVNNEKIKMYDSVCSNNVQKDELLVETPLLNTESASLMEDIINLSANIDIDPISDNKTSTQPCSTNELSNMSLSVDLINGIHQHGCQNLTSLQLKCLSHCMNGQDIIFHSNPYVGKTTVCLISVLQRINTGLNECQAVVLVPTLELALSAQKMIESIGKFLNVTTCIGGTNVPHKVSPVPHVVVSTLCSLCDMINCNSLCKDFIKVLIVDDADEMFMCNGFSNQIRNVLQFLNSNCQLIIVSTSKLEEIFAQFADILHNLEYIIMQDETPFLNDISQYYINVSEDWKFDAVCELYEILDLERAVVYCNSWIKTLGIAENMRLKTYTVSAVHNEMDTSERQLILEQFQSGTSKLLITTGLMRGEYLPDVAWVINYDLPIKSKEYVRRIVGCFTRSIKVINFITRNDIWAKNNIETTYKIQMFYFPHDVIDLCISNMEPINY